MNTPTGPARIALIVAVLLTAAALVAAITLGPVQLVVHGVDVGAELRRLASMPPDERIGLAIGGWITLVITASIVLAALPLTALQGLLLAVLALAWMLLALGVSLVAAVVLLVPLVGLTGLLIWATRRIWAWRSR